MNPKMKMRAELEAKFEARLAKKTAELEKEYQLKLEQAEQNFNQMLDMVLQQSSDAALFAADDVFDVNEYSAAKFHKAHVEYVNKIAHMAVVEDKDDRDMWWTKDTVDRKLLQIVGKDNFEPWDVRYTGRGKK